MSIKDSIEKNPVIWILGMLLAGFTAGFSAYKTILVVSKAEVISQNEFDRLMQLERKNSELVELLNEKNKSNNFGADPSSDIHYLSYERNGNVPGNLITNNTVELGKKFYSFSNVLHRASNFSFVFSSICSLNLFFT